MSFLLSAEVRDPTRGQLAVGPTLLPPATWGPYWVVAAGPGGATYDWAIVSGGPPTVAGSTAGTCRNPTGMLSLVGSGEGLWLFTRDSVAPNSTVQTMRGIAAGLGFDLNVLHPVTQADCTYDAFPSASARIRG